MGISDTELVRRAQAGDVEAFAALVERHRDAIVRLVRSFARGPDDAHDMAQDTMVSAFQKLGTLREADRFGPWLRQIAINVARQWWRREAQISFEPLWDDTEPAGAATGCAGDAASARLRAVVQDALAALPPEPRSVVLLHYFDGYDYGETAALLEVPVSTVRGRLHLARRKLREEMAELAPTRTKSERAQTATQAFDLTADDLAALRGAELLASRDPERPVLQTVCIEPDGSLVSTDTHRLYLYRGSSIRPSSRVLVHRSLSGWLAHRAQMESAHLALAGAEARLRFVAPRVTPSEHVHRAAVVTEGRYPKYERIIPSEAKVSALLSVRDLLAALEEVARFERFVSSTAMPDMAHERQKITLTVSPRTATVAVQTSAMKSEPAATRWTVQTEVPAELRGLREAEEFTVALNRTYLRECIQALEVPAGGRIDLRLNDPHQPVRIQPEGTEERFAVVMPMHLHIS